MRSASPAAVAADAAATSSATGKVYVGAVCVTVFVSSATVTDATNSDLSKRAFAVAKSNSLFISAALSAVDAFALFVFALTSFCGADLLLIIRT